MRTIGGASAFAVLSLITFTLAQTSPTPQRCPYTPEWKTCLEDPDVECATMQVPKNWYDASQGDIVLRLIRDPVVDANGDVDESAFSIFYNPGGPGGSGIHSVLENSGLDKNGVIRSRLKRITGQKFHIVSFDNRGVGLNEGYKCTSPKGMARGRDGSYEDEDLQNEINFFKQKALDCDAYSRQNSDLGRRMGTPFVARDIREVSRVINSDKMIRYYGASYGTVLGDTLAKLFPNEIAKMTMDGNINPNDYYQPQLQDEEVSDLDAGFEALFDRCADATEDRCAWKTPANEERTKETLLKKFGDWVGADPTSTNRGRNDSPLEYTDDSDPAENLATTNYRSYVVRSLVRDALRSPSQFRKLATILQYWYENPTQIKGGIDIDSYVVPDSSSTKRQSTDSGFLFTDSNYDPTTAEAAEKATVNELEGITCSENTFRNTNPQVADYRSILNKYLQRSKYAGDAGIGIISSCYPWITTSFEPALSRFQGIRTQNPVLFVQTTFDPVTPSLSGQAARDAFAPDSASIIYSSGFGHCIAADPSRTMDAAILAYWTQDILPVDGTRFSPTNPNPFLEPPDKDTMVNDGTSPDGTDTTDNPPSANAQRRDLSYLFAGTSGQPISRRRRFTFPRRQASDLVIQETCDSDNSTSTTSTQSQSSATTTGLGSDSTSTTSTQSQTSTTATGLGPNNTSTVGTSTTTSFKSVLITSLPSTSSNTQSKTSITVSGLPWKTTGKATITVGTSTGVGYGSGWATWSSASSVKPSAGTSSWASWNPATSSNKAASTWIQWDPSQPKTTTPAVWQEWSGQSGSVPVTKTVCGEYNEDCKIVVVAVATTTVYIDYVQDVCATGLYTNTVTVTATCKSGCEGKPTGIPQGYTTSVVYCSACAPASTVTVTVKADTQQAWQAVSSAADQSGQSSVNRISSIAAQRTQDSWQAVSSVAAQAGQATTNKVSYIGVSATSTSWNTWNASPTAVNVAKYTGAAVKNIASGGMLAAFAAGVLL